MILSDELKQAAEALGESLRATEPVSTYLQAQTRLQEDAEASALENRLTRLYQDLLARQQAGELLPQAEVNEFYALRDQVSSHPVVAERDAALDQLKSYLADIAAELSEPLGMDYTALV